ncbi:TIGR01777 family oxidoreductase [Cellulomonas fengjieae]|uniref:TIGR01777 family oxidoreductase n=1 Tax=Cellulomonas fengjieae TaxID=2819978 RepID=A0ABS3SF63_9CELL|nr:TIGR01777 family oxidoreductase [Cellulomonas fengjieae]MBO3084134.1 TIGR01777 family oxidoreductase [Cellulomonas fengjieae]QVI64612.1 TIGR01777 family oxidoreductase [Cellulomonas fengjieae]
MLVVIAGSHGFIGTALVPHLRRSGHEVRILVRAEAHGPAEIPWDPGTGRLDPHALAGADAVVNLAGVNVGSRPLTAARKREVLSSRLLTTDLLSRTLASLDDRPRVLLQASGIGAYGSRGDDVLDEGEPLGTTFFAGVVRRWEAATAPAQDAEVRVVHLRTGIVLGQGGGALGRLLPVLKAGLGGRLGSGRQFWPWITLVDEVRAIEHLLTAPVHGPVNLVTAPSRNAEVVAALARALHRPVVVPVPAFALRAVLGDFSSEVLGSIRAVPAVLDASGFVPTHGDLRSAAEWVARAR